MKKLFLIAFCSITIFSSCVKEKSYTCECTYVPNIPPNPVGTPNKVESLTVKARLREQASDNCSIDNENKYTTQGYKGTCILKD
ncbi:MAG: hypothetical protein IPI22_16165 [Bacteroidetes bacterium]|jgi:hypothetical protein|nr:hypothetical protein [Bacteroidota bacterium]